MFSLSVFADDDTSDTDIKLSYQRVCEYIVQHDILANITYDAYSAGFLESDYSTIQEYEVAVESLFNAGKPLYSGSLSGKYFYNTGTSCPANAVYSNASYNLLNTVKVGNLIFEDAGGPSGLTNHIAIVEGKFYDSVSKKDYIRLVEAIDVGVVRSILDDTRFKERQGTVLRADSSTSTQRSNAVKFAIGELGSSYLYDASWNTASTETSWYCSELAYAAYKSTGYALVYDDEKKSALGILPSAILNSDRTSSVLTYTKK